MKNWPKEQLRRDVDAMVAAVKQAVLKQFGTSVESIIFKGSASKQWTSPIDYVPGFSDVDIHVQLKKNMRLSLSAALAFSQQVERTVLAKQHTHLPLLQLRFLGKEKRHYNPTPKDARMVLYGKERKYTLQLKAALEQERKNLLEHNAFLEELPRRVMYKQGPYLERILSDITWRVSPTAFRVLVLKGLPYDRVWSSNRTQATHLLKNIGERKLAEHYTKFYTLLWKYVQKKDTAILRDAIAEGVAVIERGKAIATVSSRR